MNAWTLELSETVYLTDVDAVESVADMRRFPHVEQLLVDLETTHAAAESSSDPRHVTDE